MPNYQGVWSLSTQFQNASGWPNPPIIPRAVFGGNSTSSNAMDYVTITTLGNAADFGDFTTSSAEYGSVANSTRGVFCGGGGTNTMQYITIDTLGDTIDFGDLTVAGNQTMGSANDTRGIMGGRSGFSNVIDYITIGTTGNATDFGDLTVARYWGGGCSSTTRSLFAAGQDTGTFGPYSNVIDYVTIASTGNATDFGDVSAIDGRGTFGLSSDTRGIFAGGERLSGTGDEIEYVTIASTGNTSTFGDLTVVRFDGASAASKTRGLFAGSDGNLASIDYITIASTGNAADFGDLVVGRKGFAGVSNAHGGLA